MFYAAIDPGQTGAFAFLCTCDKPILKTHVMPVLGSGSKKEIDIQGARRILAENRPQLVVLERVGAMPKQGVSSTFKFGTGWGIMQGLLVGLEIPYVLVRPQDWKKAVLRGFNTKDKDSSCKYCVQRYPEYDFRATPRCRKPHDGICDAVCMAEYGIEKYAGESGEKM
jgi:crossover junction endodeoxyribonuclease RuvC